jgi:hypothetical protein
MKRFFYFVIVLSLSLSLFGCSTNNIDDEQKAPSAEAGITGYVMKKDNGRILVISQVAKDFSSTGGVEEFYDAIWFSNAPKDIQVGDKVKVWYDLVLESYPGQSEVKYLEVITVQNPIGANFTEAEALSIALKNKQINNDELIVVKSIKYDKQSDSWNIELKEIWNDKTYNLKVEDR